MVTPAGSFADSHRIHAWRGIGRRCVAYWPVSTFARAHDFASDRRHSGSGGTALQTSIMTLSDISRSVDDLCLNSRVVRAARVRSFSRARKSDRLGKGNELPFAELHRVTKLVVIDRTAKDGRQPFGGAE